MNASQARWAMGAWPNPPGRAIVSHPPSPPNPAPGSDHGGLAPAAAFDCGAEGHALTADLAALAQQCSVCRRCPLAQGRQQVVVSRGNPQARLMLIGEAPAANPLWGVRASCWISCWQRPASTATWTPTSATP